MDTNPLPSPMPRTRGPARRGRTCIRRRLLALAGATLLGMCLQAPAATIDVPNGDFSASGNIGSVGGGLLNPSDTRLIGEGPWSAHYDGIISVIAPPTMTIGGGNASVAGLAGITALGIINNGGYFTQTLGTAWQANRRYTLSAEVTASGTLGLSLLEAGNAGVALKMGTSRFCTSTTPGLARLTLLSSQRWKLQIECDSGTSVSGNIGVDLLAEPAGLLTANLLTGISFDNVTLGSRLSNQVPASLIAVDATPRSAVVGTTVNPPLTVQVLDVEGEPIQGVQVSFTWPSSGASATVSPNPAVTGPDGTISVTTTANTIAGSYTILAQVSGVATPISFAMTNRAGAPAALRDASGSGQHAEVTQTFAAPLTTQVVDAYSNPVPDVDVAFSAPSTGASASLPPTASTDQNGRVAVVPVANTVAGSYVVGASVAGVSAGATFALDNDAGAPASIGTADGSGQGAVVLTPFGAPLSVTIADAYGNPVGGATATFEAPASGASANLGSGTAVTGPNGRASINAVANGTIGGYTVKAYAAGVDQPTLFSLTNLLSPTVVPEANGGSGQNGQINGLFSCVLLVRVSENGVPKPGLQVDFTAPASGPSATLSRGGTSGTSLRVPSDGNGFAWVEATANGIPGRFVVNAQLVYSTAAPVEFRLNNLAPNEPVFADGFDGTCVVAVGGGAHDSD